MLNLKALAACLPTGLQQELRRYHWRRKIGRNEFSAGEPEFARLRRFLGRGDVAIDVGANVGQYTRRMATIVGDLGKVFAIEPIAETFSLLAANCFGLGNVTLLNLAASSHPREVCLDLPETSGQTNYYRAAISDRGSRRATAIPLDAFPLPIDRLSLIKIDAEGHDLEVLRGAENLLERFRPRLIVEADQDNAIESWLSDHDYHTLRLPGSPNIIAHHRAQALPDLTRADQDKRFGEVENSAW